MSEVDRVSNSGLYPALPIPDKRSRKDGSGGQQPGTDGKTADKGPGSESPPAATRDPARPPKSLIDDYA
jgi:hypothetical protein